LSDIEWEKFIKEIVDQGKEINLVKACKEKSVGLNTLYRKVSKLEKTNPLLYQEFTSLHPYQPRDTQGIDFEQLMRECIITGISQKGLENKYDISKRTIQRKFAKIEEENYALYSVYKTYVDALKLGKTLHESVMDKVIEEYVPQQKITEEEKLKKRREKFLESMRETKDTNKMDTYRHCREQIERIDQQIAEKEKKKDKEEGGTR
jgi:hypothetical protein